MTAGFRCWLTLVMVLTANLLWSGLVWAQGGALPGPTDPAAALTQAGELVNLAKTGQWLMFSFLAIKAIWGLLEYAPIKKRLAQYGMELNILFGAIAAALAVVVGGASWMEAAIVFFTGPGADVVHDLLSILWKKKLKADAEVKAGGGG